MAQVALTYRLLDAPLNGHLIALIGASTFFLYNFSLFLSKPKNFTPSAHRRTNWFFSHYKTLVILSGLSFCLLFPLAFSLSFNSLKLLASISLIAFSYNLPVLKIGNKRFNMRNVPGIKLFIIASVWAGSCVWLPIMELKNTGTEVSAFDTFLLVTKRFLFVLAITLPFDMRDLYQDRQFNLKTIPVLIGQNNSYILCLAMLFTYLLLLFKFSPNSPALTGALGLSIGVTALLLLQSKKQKNEYFYFLLLDGTLLFQYLIVEAAIKI